MVTNAGYIYLSLDGGSNMFYLRSHAQTPLQRGPAQSNRLSG